MEEIAPPITNPTTSLRNVRRFFRGRSLRRKKNMDLSIANLASRALPRKLVHVTYFSSLLEPRPVPAVVAILNVTPDSFYDGGLYASTDAVLARAKQCLEEGADVLELGAESTGPGSVDISGDEEIARLLPALTAIHTAFPQALLSVDTYKASVADAALNAGASCINDVTAGRADPQMLSVIGARQAYCVLMYSKDQTPRTTKQDTQYDDVIAHIHDFLTDRIQAAVDAGVDRLSIIVDPGLGHFVSADPRYSFQILESLHAFTDLGPVFVSPSRKSFLAGSENLPVSERLPATLAASVLAAQNGASFIRTHDIAATKQALLAWQASSSR